MLNNDYVHFVPAAKDNPEYGDSIKKVLVRSMQELQNLLQLEDKIVGWDTETTGLNPEESDIVGFSWSTDGQTAYYCPVAHEDLQIPGSLELFVERLETAKLSLIYTARFDIRMVEYQLRKNKSLLNVDFLRNKFIDVMNVVWLSDTNVSMPSLKKSTKHFLGYEPPKFAETLGAATNFKFVPAEDAYEYACLDAANTYNLFKVCQRYHEEAGIAAYLDTQTSWILGHLEETPLKLDTEHVRKMADEVSVELDTLRARIYALAGKEFNLNSGKQLTEVFLGLGIDTGARTATGYMKCSIELFTQYLSRYPETEIVALLVRYKGLFKFYNSYLQTLVKCGEKQDTHPIRFSYKLQGAPTSRMACCHKDTLIYTDNGIKRIVDIDENDQVDDGTGKFRAAALLEMGEQPFRSLKFSDGTTALFTPEHKVLCIAEQGYIWKEVCTLTDNDKVCTKYTARMQVPLDKNFLVFCLLTLSSVLLDDGNRALKMDQRANANRLLVVRKHLKDCGMRATFRNEGVPCYILNEREVKNICAPYDVVDGRISLANINSLAAARAYLYALHLLGSLKDSKELFSSNDAQLTKDIHTVLRYCGCTTTITINDAGAHNICTQTTGLINFIRGLREQQCSMVPDFLKDYLTHNNVANYEINRTANGRSVLRAIQKGSCLSLIAEAIAKFNIDLPCFTYITVLSNEDFGVDTAYTLAVKSSQHRYMSASVISQNCGKDGKNTFFSPVNAQSLPKPKSIKCFGRTATSEEIARKDDLLGWVFSDEHPEWSPGKIVEGMSSKMNVRKAFITDKPDDLFVSIDMSGEELRIVANMFKEPFWADIINSGGDLHREMSDKIFGPENYTKETRRKAKAASFGLLYGQGTTGFHRKFPSMSIEEVEAFLDTFKKLIPNVIIGQARMIKEAKKTGTFYSCFGHPRRVKAYFASRSGRDRSFGERTVQNGPIQGTAADVLKLEFIRLWDNVFLKYPEDIKFHTTIHDEINFSVARSKAREIIPLLIKCMTVKLDTWVVPLDCSLSVGTTMGDLIPFKYDAVTAEFSPDWENDERTSADTMYPDGGDTDDSGEEDYDEVAFVL